MLEKFKKAGKRIEFLRKYKGLDEGKMASQLGITVETLRKIETDGTDINGELLFEVSKFFEVDHNYIFEGYVDRIQDHKFLGEIKKFESTME